MFNNKNKIFKLKYKSRIQVIVDGWFFLYEYNYCFVEQVHTFFSQFEDLKFGKNDTFEHTNMIRHRITYRSVTYYRSV